MFKLKRPSIAFLASTSLLLSACAIGPDYHRAPIDLPSQAQAKISSDIQPIPVDHTWWRSFNDPELDALITEAITYNKDLLIASARVDQAWASARIANASLLPSISASGTGQNIGYSSEQSITNQRYVGRSRSIGLSLDWELDLWGRLRRLSEAGRANYNASIADRNSAELSLATTVAQTYFQLRAYDAQLAVVKSTLTTREKSLVIQKRRFDSGLISGLDFSQAQSETEAARATLPTIEYGIEQTKNALSVLVGRSPRSIVEDNIKRGKAIQDLPIPPEVPAELSSLTLLNHPDVVSAENKLIAANAQIGVARAAYFPQISLSSGIGSQSAQLSNLLAGPAGTWNFIANLAMPIFNWGTTQNNVRIANSQQKQALASYQKAIQVAFKDALNALSYRSSSKARMQALDAQIKALKQNLHLAQLRYDNGYSDYLEVLNADRSVLQVQLDEINSNLDELKAAVDLYKVLGGGWAADTINPHGSDLIGKE